jgi:antitoxin ParD1/3/4
MESTFSTDRQCGIERRFAALDVTIERGLADIKAGRVHDADTVFDELEVRYTSMARGRSEI